MKIVSRKFKIIIILFIVIIVVIISRSLYNNRYNNSIKTSLKDAKTLKTEEALKESMVSEINKLYELPADTEVIVGTITNIEELKSKQKYFEKAKNGDLLLIYPDKTIIYDPVTKTVVDVVGVRLLK